VIPPPRAGQVSSQVANRDKLQSVATSTGGQLFDATSNSLGTGCMQMSRRSSRAA
jgi:hypothetical protein